MTALTWYFDCECDARFYCAAEIVVCPRCGRLIEATQRMAPPATSVVDELAGMTVAEPVRPARVVRVSASRGMDRTRVSRLRERNPWADEA